MTLGRIMEPAAFLAAYVFLDYVSFIHSYSSLSITPWNPQTGMAVALLLLRGARWTPLLFVSALAADLLIRGPMNTVALTVMPAAVIALAYGGLAFGLRRLLRLDTALLRLRDILLLNIGAAATAMAVAVFYVSAFVWAGSIMPADYDAAITRLWIGDMIGIAVVTPLLLKLHRYVPRVPSSRNIVEAVLQMSAIILMVWIVFGLSRSDEFRLFYLLFLPLIWSAARFGLLGATMANLLTQGALIVAFQVSGHESTTVTDFQLLMLVLTLASLTLGAAVSEGRRTAIRLQARQAELAHFSRLSLAGEMAAALAHELNQPLMASIAFARAAQRLLDRSPDDPTKARAAIDRAVGEAQRAGDIIKSLRQFIGHDQLVHQRTNPVKVVADAVSLAAPEAKRMAMRLTAGTDKSLPDLHIDRVQIQQVLINLIRNALEAMAKADSVDPLVTISAANKDGCVVFEVADSGPGISPEVAERLFEPFNTSKATGMGLGLSICRTLVEAHGGIIWLEHTGPCGTAFRFSLPTEPTESDQA